jgi:hypothetical protein
MKQFDTGEGLKSQFKWHFNSSLFVKQALRGFEKDSISVFNPYFQGVGRSNTLSPRPKQINHYFSVPNLKIRPLILLNLGLIACSSNPLFRF